MQRLLGSELAGLGRRLAAELDTPNLSPPVQHALERLIDAETTARVRRGPDTALRVNGYL